MHNNQPKPRSAKILIVDDTPENLRLLSELLEEQGYDTRPIPNGEAALKVARFEPPDLILLDINMPGINGFEVCKRLKEDDHLKGIPVLFISALEDTTNKVKAFEVGGVDYITKPFQFEEVNARVKTHLNLHNLQLNLEDMVQEKSAEISASQMSTIFALAKLAEFRDDDTGKHIERVQVYCKTLAEDLKQHPKFRQGITPKFIQDLHFASPLHDIGKVGIPDAILLKPGRLTPEEFENIKTHTIIGAETLEQVKTQYPNNVFLQTGMKIARSHHERWDGSGYPDQLSAENIPLSARITSVADVYDALRTERPYKSGFSHEKSVQIIAEGGGSQFDPDIVDCFLENESEFEATHDTMTV